MGFSSALPFHNAPLFTHMSYFTFMFLLPLLQQSSHSHLGYWENMGPQLFAQEVGVARLQSFPLKKIVTLPLWSEQLLFTHARECEDKYQRANQIKEANQTPSQNKCAYLTTTWVIFSDVVRSRHCHLESVLGTSPSPEQKKPKQNTSPVWSIPNKHCVNSLPLSYDQ